MAYLNNINTGGVSLPQLPLGPLTGAMTGINFQTAQDMNGRLMRDDDLEYMINQIKQQQDQSNLAVTQAKNQNELLNQGLLRGQYDSGLKGAQLDAAVLADTSGNQAKGVAAQQSIDQSMAVPTVQFGEYLESKGGKFDPTNQADLDAWNTLFAGPARRVGMKVDAAPDPQQIEGLLRKKQAYLQSIPYQQQIGAITAKGQIQKDVTGMQSESAENVANINNRGRVAAAQVTANANITRTEMQTEALKNAQDNLLATMKHLKRQGGYSPEDVALLEQQAQRVFAQDPEFSLKLTILGTDPVKNADQIQQVHDAINAKAARWLSQDPDFVKAAQGAGVSTSGTKSVSKATPVNDKVVTVKSDDDYAKLPSGATFVGPDGVKRKKP